MEVERDTEGAINNSFTKFADALTEFKIAQLNGEEDADPLDLIKNFRAIAAATSLHLVELSDGAENKACKDYELEAKLWHLMELLMEFRSSDGLDEDILKSYNELESFNSGAIFEKELMMKNKSLYQIWIIIIWLQSNLPAVERPKSLPVTKWSNTMINGNMKSADLDLPLRDVTIQLDERDRNDDHIFYKYIFNLLLKGEYERIFEESALADNLTLNMIMCGMQEYVDPKVDYQLKEEFEVQQGVKQRALWRRAVYNLSQNPSLDKYERAIYSYLSGVVSTEDIEEDLTWETELLLYMRQTLNTEVEKYMLENGKAIKEELIVPMPMRSLDLQSILNFVSSKHLTESEHPIRVLMGAVIMDNLSTILSSSVNMLMDIIDGTDNDNELFNEPYLLRVVTHISIFTQSLNLGTMSQQEITKLITAYVSILKLKNLEDLIPVYVSFLDSDDIQECYSFILSSIEDKSMRLKQLQLCNFLKLPTSNILKRTTQRVFVETELDYTPSSEIIITTEISDEDRYLMRSVEWLIDGKMYEDAVSSIIPMTRRFLINGKIKSLESFFTKNNVTEILKNYQLEKLSDPNFENGEDMHIKELQEYQQLVAIFQQYFEWQRTVKRLNSESNIPSLIEKFQDYSKNTQFLITSFLVELIDLAEGKDNEILYEIRALYAPHLIMELFQGLVEAADLLNISKYIKEAISLTNLVANEKDKIYLLFQASGRLKEFLHLVAHTSTLVKEK